MQSIENQQYDLSKIKLQIDSYIKSYLEFHNKLYVAILGGEPLTEYNKDITLSISKHIKEKYPKSTIVLYSWRDIDIIDVKYIKYIDYGVLGEYEDDLYIKNMLPASTNQYIYNFATNSKVDSIKLKKEMV